MLEETSLTNALQDASIEAELRQANKDYREAKTRHHLLIEAGEFDEANMAYKDICFHAGQVAFLVNALESGGEA